MKLKMNIPFFCLKSQNFGDAVNIRFFNLLTNEQHRCSCVHDLTKLHFVCTGSIMNCVNNMSIIYGTGFIDENAPLGGYRFGWSENYNKVLSKPKNIISVRGPKTRNKLLKMDIECPKNYGDPLILFPLVYNNLNINKKVGKVGIIPHYTDKNSENVKLLYKNLKEHYTVELIDIMVGTNYKKFIDQILECDYIISSALHGIMMGLVYKKKTILVEFSKNVAGELFKFNDFFESLDINYDVKNIYNIKLLNNIIQVDFNTLKNISENMINIAPFIDNKPQLVKLCNKYYQ